MKTKTMLCAGAVLLFVCSLAIVAGHELLARSLIGRSLPDDAVMSARFATVAASLIVHGYTGVFVLPMALLAHRFGVPVDALRTCVCTALSAVICRVAAELWTGGLFSGYPVLGVSATAVVMSIALAPRSSRRPGSVRTVGACDPMPRFASSAGGSPFRESA